MSVIYFNAIVNKVIENAKWVRNQEPFCLLTIHFHYLLCGLKYYPKIYDPFNKIKRNIIFHFSRARVAII